MNKFPQTYPKTYPRISERLDAVADLNDAVSISHPITSEKAIPIVISAIEMVSE